MRRKETCVEPFPYFIYNRNKKKRVVRSVPCLAEKRREHQHSVPLFLLFHGLFSRGRGEKATSYSFLIGEGGDVRSKLSSPSR